FFVDGYKQYAWSKLLDSRLGGFDRLNLYVEALAKMPQNPHLPQLFRDIFKDAFLPYRDPETLNLFLKEINSFTYDHSENLGNSFEYLLSVMDSQGDAGQFRTPRHIIDFIVKVVDPAKEDTILDPACGTAGFLISAYKHILRQNTAKRLGDQLSPDEKTRLMRHFVGYDISPEMVRLSLVNLYLHGFPNPNIREYDTLTSEERWDEHYDVIMANPPFMSPKGGIRPHKRFSIQASRSEVLFVDYIAEHLNIHGRAGVIVPEGIIFQSGTAYKALRKMLIEKYVWAVVSLPSGIFQPYSGVKTSILLMDRNLAKKADSILFVKVENDGFDLGSQRRPIDKNDLTQALAILQPYKQALQENRDVRDMFSDGEESSLATIVEKAKIAKNGDYNLSGDRYKPITSFTNQKWPMVDIREVCEFKNGLWKGKNPPYEKVKILRNTNFTKDGRLNFDDVAEHDVEINQLETRIMEYGDIILEKSGGGPSQPVGRVALFTLTQTDGKYSYSNFTSRIRVTDERIEPIF
ncbi:MAG TPA: N-6 DNA methylase, partial [Methylomirabilota bacterium]|nr:N-6 DNA methylase [Methylomirabilota bacterium]